VRHGTRRGYFFDFKGDNTINGGNCVAAVPALADEVLRFLKQ
jgi:hypothetical protein